MDWTDDGIVLSVRRHGETGIIASVLTSGHGRHAGLIHGGVGREQRGALQPGNSVRVWWRARLADQLGSYRVELIRANAAAVLDDPERLAALSSACALSDAALPERQPHGASFAALTALLDAFSSESWPTVYIHWELALLRDLGYGLDLGQCAATGVTDDLCYVSPKTGRAVSRQAGAPYQDKLLALPEFLAQGGEGDRLAIWQGLQLSGFFLDRHLHVGVPAARSRLVDRFRP